MAPVQSMPEPALGKVALPVLDCTPLFSGAPLDEASAIRLASILKVLGEPARLRLLSLIQAQPSHEACVCHLTDALDLSQPTVSHHLRVLFEAGLLERQRRGNWVYYRAVSGALDGVLEALGGPVGQRRAAALAAGHDCRCL
jgi:ArsR family transcriptional regulator, arsenate/arsenite/antimonite-responsive transcriptional repressor